MPMLPVSPGAHDTTSYHQRLTYATGSIHMKSAVYTELGSLLGRMIRGRFVMDEPNFLLETVFSATYAGEGWSATQ